MAYAALFIATTVPLLFLFLIHTLDLYGTGSRRALLLSFAWGALSVFIAVATYRLLQARLAFLDEDALAFFIAPILEELIKALVLIYLIRRPTFTYFVDGAIYGFAAGIGFAVFENYLYILQNLDMGLGTALGRVLSTNLMHASAGAIVGIALGFARFKRFSGRVLLMLSGLLLSILLHATFNRLVAYSGQSHLFLFAVGVGLCGVSFTALAIRRGLAIERTWISETLGLANRVTPSEASAARRLDRTNKLLAPLDTVFGPRKAKQIEEMLRLQAQLGILRKTQERSRGQPSTARALSLEIERKQQEMETLRHNIGAYTMASLRMLFPGQGDAIWQHIETTLGNQDESRQDARHNLFTLIQNRSHSPDGTSDPEE